jgi:hypothetical protein
VRGVELELHSTRERILKTPVRATF